jgi:two-component system response regulator FixJ
MSAEPTVYVIDDDTAVCRSLERRLDAAGVRAVSYGSPLAFLEAVPALSPDCILLDIRMPGMDGLELQAHLTELGISPPIIVMTGHGDVQSAVRAMKAGAVDFIEKPYNEETLLNAIETALTKSGRSARDREAAQTARRIATLSQREREVLDAMLMGRPNKVIAFDLGISVRTVEVHRAGMMERLGTRQLAEAIRVAVMAKLAPTPDRHGR